MAKPQYGGIAYITLDGDQISWLSNHANKTDILLDGSHFHNVVSVTTLAISGLCAAAFVIILWEYLRRRGPRRYETDSKGKKKHKYSVGTAMGLMILFYATDLYNRVEHEKRKVISAYYIAIDIPLGIFPSLADGLLLVYLLRRSPVQITSANKPSRYIMYFAFGMYWMIGVCTKGAQIWSVITQFTPPDHGCDDQNQETDHCKVEHGIQLSLNIEQYLDSAATGMLMLFSIGYALFAIRYIRRPTETHSSQMRPSIAIGFLAVFFLARNIVHFAFTLLYDQFNREEHGGTQLAYVALWGLLSIGGYTSAVVVEATQGKTGRLTYEERSQPPERDYSTEAGIWSGKKSKTSAGTYSYPSGYSYPSNYTR